MLRVLQRFSGRKGDSDGLRSAVITLASGQALRLLVQAAYLIVVARALSPSLYGAFIAVVAAATMVSPFSSLGSNILMVRNISRKETAHAFEWQRASFYTVVVGLGLSFLVGGFGPLFLGGAVSYWSCLLIAFSELVGMRCVEVSGFYWQARRNPRPAAYLPVGLNAVRLGAALGLFAAPPDDRLDLWALLSCTVSIPFGLTVVWVTTIKAQPIWRWPILDRHELKQGLLFSTGSSAQTVYNDLDKSMVASLGTTLSAGVYGAAYRVIDMAYAPVRAIAAAAYPKFFKQGEEGLAGSLLLVRRVAPVSFGYSIVAAVVLVAAAPLVPVLLGREYSGSVEVVRMLAVLLVLRVATYLSADALTGADRQQARTSLQLAVAAINFALNLYAIPRFGLYGAVVTTLVCEALLASSLWIVIWKAVRRDSRQHHPAQRTRS